MLYDLADGPPPPGSPLESLFLVISKRRQEAEFLKTRVLIEAARSSQEGSNLSEAFQDYADVLFPYLRAEKKTKEQTTKEALEKWSSVGAIKIRPVQRGLENRGTISRIKRDAERLQKLQEERKKQKRKRI